MDSKSCSSEAATVAGRFQLPAVIAAFGDYNNHLELAKKGKRTDVRRVSPRKNGIYSMKGKAAQLYSAAIESLAKLRKHPSISDGER